MTHPDRMGRFLTRSAGSRLAVESCRTLLAAIAAISVVLSIYGFLAFPELSDFRAFYEDGHAWNTGGELYRDTEHLNLNPPLLTVAFFAPLAHLSGFSARWLWLGLSAVAFVASVRLVRRELSLSTGQTMSATALLLLTHGAFIATLQGQLGWLLLYPLTQAWVVHRHDRPVAAGCWLAAAIAAKPPLALVALLLPWRTLLTAGILSASLSAIALLVTGWQPWAAWLETSARIHWLYMPLNASLWGVAARLEHGHVPAVLTDLSPVAVTLVLAIVALLAWTAYRQPDPDRRFAGAVFWSVLVSPLGWGHYLPLAFGPVLATWPSSRLAWTAYALTLLPVGGAPNLGPVVGSAFCAAVLCAWTSIVTPKASGVSHVAVLQGQ